MFRKDVPGAQMQAWIFVAMTAPLAQKLSGCGWVFAAIAGVICSVIVWGAVRLTAGADWKPWFCAVEVIWLAIALAICAGEAAGSWPMGDAWPVVPLVMLALAGWSAQKGPQVASRVAGVLFFLILIGYVPIFGAGAGQADWGELLPRWGRDDGTAGFWLLMPGVAAFLPWQKRRMGKALAGTVAFGIIAAGITCGVLTPALAQMVDTPFYEMSRSLSLLGMAERFEALVCALLTVGWYAALSLLLSAGGCLFGRIWKGKEPVGVWCLTLAAAAAVLCRLRTWGLLPAIGAAVFWIALPMLAGGLKKVEKI